MNLANLLSEIQLVLPAMETPRVISALREDPVVWAGLLDPDLSKRVLIYCGDQGDKWTPGILALLALSKPYDFGELSEGLLESLHVKYKSSASEKYDEFTQNPYPIVTIEDAGVLALALREKFLSQKSWEGLLDWISLDLTETQNVSHWRTVLTCLYGMIENPDEMLLSLLSGDLTQEKLLCTSHILLSNPLEDELRAQIVLDIMDHLSIGQKVSWLGIFKLKGFSNLVRIIANKLINSGKVSFEKTYENPTLVNIDLGKWACAITDLHQLAIIYQYGGEADKAALLIHKAGEEFQYHLAELNLQAIQLDPSDDNFNNSIETIKIFLKTSKKSKDFQSEMALVGGLSADQNKITRELIKNWEHPLAQIIQAGWLSEKGEKPQAQALAKNAVNLLIDQVDPGDLDLPLRNLLDWEPLPFINRLLELELPQHALELAKIFLKNRPSDGKLIALIATLMASLDDNEGAIDLAQLQNLLSPQDPEAPRLLADLWQTLGDWEKVFRQRERVIKILPEAGLEDWVGYAISANRVNDHESAAQGCRKILEKQADHPFANAILGQSLFTLGKREEAEKYLRTAVDLQPDDVENWLNLSNLYRKNGEIETSLEILVSGLSSHPEEVELHRQIGDIWTVLRNWENAFIHRSQVVQMAQQPTAADWLAFASSAFKTNNFSQAIEGCLKVIESDPGRGEVNSIIGQSLYLSGDEEKAQFYLEGGIRADPQSVENWLYISDYQAKMGEGQKSLETLVSALAIFPENIEAHRRIANCYEAQGSWENSLEHRKSIIATASQPGIEDWISLAKSQLMNDEPREAVDTTAKILASFPENGQAFSIMGRSLFRLGENEEALKCLNKAVHLAPEIPESWLTLYESQKQNNETKRGLETLRSACLACPNSAEVNLALADAYLDLGQTSDALGFLQNAANLPPETSGAAARLGKALHSIGLLEDARQCMAKARQRWPQNPDLALIEAKVLLALGAVDEALPALEAALLNGNADIEAYLLYAVALVGEQSPILTPHVPESARLQKAQQVLEKALALQEGHLLAGIMMAEILAAKGQLDLAFQRYQKLVDHPEAQKSEYLWRLLAGFGKVSLEVNEVETALAVLKEAVTVQPEQVILARLLAEAYSKADLLQESFTVARGVVKASPGNIENLVWFAGIAQKSGEDSAAEEALRCATEIDAAIADNWIVLAEIQQKSGDQEGVKSSLNSLLNLDDLTEDNWRKAALIFCRMDDLNAALSCLEQAQSIVEKPSAQIHLEVACLHKKMGNQETALDNIQQAMEESPDLVALHVFEAGLYMELSRLQAAVTCLEKALGIVEAHSKDSCLEMDNESKTPLAMEILSEKWFSHALIPSGIHVRLAHIQRLLGNLSLALFHAEKAVELSPSCLAYTYLAVDLAQAFLQEERAKNLLGAMEAMVLREGILGEQYSDNYGALMGIKTEIALENGDDILAERSLNEWMPIFPHNLRFHTSQARLFASRGEVKEAQEIYNKLAVSASPDNVETPKGIVEDFSGSDLVGYWEKARNIWQADGLLDCQYWHEALELYETIAKDAKGEARPNLKYARALIICAERERLYQEVGVFTHRPGTDIFSSQNRGKLDNALQTAWKVSSAQEVKRWQARSIVAFELTPQSINAFSREAVFIEEGGVITAALRQSGNYQAAVESAARLPASPENAIQQALSNFQEDAASGLQSAIRGVEARPGNPIHQVVFALLAEKMEQKNEAYQAVEKALAIWEDEPDWHAWAATLSEEVGDGTEVVHWQRATSLNPLNVDYALKLGRTYLLMREAKKAIVVLENANRIDNENIDIWLALSDANQLAGNLDQALFCAESAKKLAPETSSPLLKCGQISLMMGKADNALRFARESQKMDPMCVDSLMLIAEILVRQGKVQEAYQMLDSAPREIAEEFRVLFTKATLMRELKGGRDALPIVKGLTAKYPDSPEALELLAHIQEECGDYPGAEEAALSSLERQPDQPILNHLLGRLVRKAGQLDQAIHFFGEAISQDPLLAKAYQDLGETYQERREYLQALQVYEEGIKFLPKDHHLYFSAALVMREVKNYVGAETMLRRASELAPDDINIRRQLGAVIALNLVHNPQE
jgi:tetratricopeptide (TPR) repeat protein